MIIKFDYLVVLILVSIAIISSSCVGLFNSSLEHNFYTVQKGDNLTSIADRYGTSVQAILDENPRLGDPDLLEVGDVLELPVMVKKYSNVARAMLRHGDTSLSKELLHSFVQQWKGNVLWPISPDAGKVTSKFGYRGRSFHEGIDISARTGTDVFAIAPGKVIYSGYGMRGYGKLLVIKHQDFFSVYAHNSRLFFDKGDEVSRGELIAEVGSTGNASGSHLHFEVRVRNPSDLYVAINPGLLYGLKENTY